MKPTPCPAEHFGFSRTIKFDDETHIQTCLKTLHNHEAYEWTTVGIVYPRPEPPRPPTPDVGWPDVVVFIGLFCLVGYLGRRLF